MIEIEAEFGSQLTRKDIENVENKLGYKFPNE
jgi:hypothetical protein